MRKIRKTAPQTILAMIYDFDGTLSPHNMQEDTIFRAYGIPKNELWNQCGRLIGNGYERTLAYLNLLIHAPYFQQNPLTRKALKKMASHLKYYPGVSSFFERMNRFVAAIPEVREWGIQLEHYIISSGMKEILEGADIYRFFKKVFACEYDYNARGSAVFPKLVINDTNKTQFLFRINKGKLNLNEDINSHMKDENRRIPFRNMLYIGDSQTDIPSMTVLQRYGGHAIAVFNPECGIPKVVKDLVREKRVDHFAPADYRKNSLLVSMIQRTLKKMIHTVAYYGSARMSLNWIKNHR